MKVISSFRWLLALGTAGLLFATPPRLLAQPALPEVTAAVPDGLAAEAGPDTAVFRIQRTAGTTGAVTVNLRWEGSAANGLDYAALATTVVLPAGAGFVDITLQPVDDGRFEGLETATMVVLPGADYSVGFPANASATIADNDVRAVVTVEATIPYAAELTGEPGEFTFTRSGPTTDPMVVPFRLAGTATNGVDYETLPASVTIPVGSSSVALPVRAINDGIPEPVETILLSLTATTEFSVGTPGVATVSVGGVAGLPAVSVIATDASAAEAGANSGTFRFQRTGSTAADLTVSFQWRGDATPGDDFANPGSTIVIPAGASVVDLTITPIDDLIFEGPETADVRLVASFSYDVAVRDASIAIADNDIPPTVTIVATDSVAAETVGLPGDGALFTVTRTGPLTAALDVPLTIGGTAVNGVDYVLLSPVATIPVGSASVTLSVVVLDDVVFEDTETVSLTVVPPLDGAFVAGLAATATATIGDNDVVPANVPLVSVVASQASTREAFPGQAVAPGAFTLTRSGPIAAALSVRFILAGTAANGVDYVTVATNVVFAPGSPVLTVDIVPLDDALLEGTETVTLVLQPGPGYGVGAPGSASVAVADNDPVVSVQAINPGAAERGSNPALLLFSRSGSLDLPLTVLFSVSGSASLGDFNPIGGSIVIPASQESIALPITPIDDLQVEAPESVVVTLIPSPGFGVGLPSATVIILDDDGPTNALPIVTLVGIDTMASEPGLNEASFLVARTGPIDNVLAVALTVGGSATPNTDYYSIGGEVWIAPGMAFTVVTPFAEDDRLFETNETVTVAIAPRSGSYVVGASNATVLTIQDDDPPPPTVSVAVLDGLASEPGANTASFLLTRTGSAAFDLPVRFTLGGLGVAGADYANPGGTALIPAGSGFTVVTITPLDDAALEPSETVTLTLAADQGYVVGSPASATVEILDNDVLPVAVTPLVHLNFDEGTGTNTLNTGSAGGTFNLTRPRPAYTNNTPAGVGGPFALDFGAAAGDFVVESTAPLAGLGGLTRFTITGWLNCRSGTTGSGGNRVVHWQNGTVDGVELVFRSDGSLQLGVDQEAASGTARSSASRIPVAAAAGADNWRFFAVTYDSTVSTGQVSYFFGSAATNAARDVIRNYTGRGAVNTNIGRLAAGHYNATRRSGRTDRVFRGLVDDVCVFGAVLTPNEIIGVQRSTAQGIVSIAASVPLVAEPGPGAAAITVSRTGPTALPLTVALTTQGTATLDADFSLPGTAITIPAGQSAVTVPVTVLDDPLYEGTEEATLVIEPAASYLIGAGASATLAIQDNDLPPPPVVRIVATAPESFEQFPDGIHTVLPAVATVWRSGPTDADLLVQYTVGGTATPGSDYQALSGTVLIPAGSASAVIAAFPTDDEDVEPIENILVGLVAGAGYIVGELSTAELLIADNDPLVTFTTITSATEAGTDGGFVIHRSGPTTGDLTVLFRTPVGTASAGIDYQGLPTAVMIPSGESSVTVPVVAFNDGDVEGTETVDLRIQTSPAYTVGLGLASVSILDNDLPDAASAILTKVSAVATVPSTLEQFRDGVHTALAGIVTLHRTGPLTTDLVVNYSVAGTAQNGLDLVTLPGQAMIPAGASSADIEVFPIDDDTVEGDENVILTVIAGTGYQVGAQPAVEVIIEDNDPAVSLQAVRSGVQEGTGVAGSFRLWRSGPTTLPLLVGLRNIGDAIPGADYIEIPLFQVIPAGQSEVMIPVQLLDDTLPEGIEAASLRVEASPDYFIGAGEAHVYIFDNEVPYPALPIVSVEATADAAEGSATPGLFTVRRTGPTTLELPVNFILSGSALANADYVEVLQSVIIPPGASSVTVPIVAKDDLLAEGDESLQLSLVADVIYQVSDTAQAASIHIHDDEPVVSVVVADAMAAEEGLNPGAFTIVRGGSTRFPVTILFAIGGSASGGSDYAPILSPVVIEAGMSSTTVVVQPLEDSLFEGTEQVSITLLPGQGYTLGEVTNAVVSIEDNEPIVTVAATTPTAGEEGPSSGLFTVSRTGPASGSLTVQFTVTGTAGSDTDYVSLGTSVTFEPGMQSTNLTVLPVDDGLQEPAETVILTLDAAVGYQVGSPASATVTLIDDEPVVTVTAVDADAAEAGPNPGRFTLTRAGSVTGPLTVQFTLEGTATAGNDYAAPGGSATFDPGMNTVDVDVVPADDMVAEPVETVTLTLSASAAYGVGTPSAATVRIADNDIPPCLVHYGFEEASGLVALDTSLNDQHGALLNGPVRTNGAVGRALRFDGSNDRVQTTNATSLNVTGAFTVACWIRPERVDVNQIILMKGNANNDAFSYGLRANNARAQYRWVSPSGTRSSYATTANSLAAGRWNHVAVVHTPGTDPLLYIDGVLTPATRSEGAAANLIGASVNPFAVGDSADNAQPFRGAIDEVFVCRGALSAADIRNLTNGLPPGPVAPPPPPAPLGIATVSPLPAGTVGIAYNLTLSATGGTPGFTWSLVSGTLPGGLLLNTNTGVLSGVPGAPVTAATFRVGVRDSLGQTAERDFQLTMAAAPVTIPGLISQWRFEEADGLAALDSAGSNPGSLLNGVTRTPSGRVGAALCFDGVDDRVSIPDAPSLDVATNFSITLWFRPGADLGATSGTQTLLKKTGSYWIAFNYAAADGKLAFALNTDSPRIKAAGPTTWVAGEWHHVACTYDGAEMRLYVDGTLQGTRPLTTTPAANSASPIFLGGDTSAGFAHFNGCLDDVRLYGAALNATDIAALATPPAPSPLLPVRPVSTPFVLSTRGTAETLAVEWQAMPGRTYRVQYTDQLENPIWQDCPEDVFAYDGVGQYFESRNGQGQRFYRVLMLP